MVPHILQLEDFATG
uniref:Uncharacterized protein n=1 Tax=Arundo donax TaxID=35708 RepID=A0A0A8XS37_ARUDO